MFVFVCFADGEDSGDLQDVGEGCLPDGSVDGMGDMGADDFKGPAANIIKTYVV